MAETKARIDWIDVAKGIAILAIIAGHLGGDVINRLVFPWHVPLFFVVGGFFISTKQTTKEFVTKKARTLLVPFVVTALAVVIARMLRSWCVGTSV